MREWLVKNRDHVLEYRKETKDKRNARRRELYAQDEWRRIQQRQKTKEWQLAHPEKRKAQRMKKYQISLQEVSQLLTNQNGRCAICGFSSMENPNLFPLVDHCHATGKVRGLLCLNCNQALGKFKDNPEVLRAAADYLESNGSSGAD